MKRNTNLTNVWVERIIIGLLVLAIGLFVMIVFNPWRSPKLDRVYDYLAKIGTGIFLLVTALFAHKSKRYKKYWPLLFTFFILIVAVSLDVIFAQYLFKYLGVTDSTPVGWALPKLNELFVVASVIVIFTFLSGSDLGSIYIQKGNLKLGITIGLIAFFIFVIGAIPMASLFQAQNLSLDRTVPWIPWILIYVLANGAMEDYCFVDCSCRNWSHFLENFSLISLLR